MPSASRDVPGTDRSDEPHRLVCGACEAVLDPAYPDRAHADAAADEHVPAEHPEHPTAVVLTVPVTFLEERAEDALAIAVGAQRRIEERRDGSVEPS